MDAEARAFFSRPWAIEPIHGSAFVASLAECIAARRAGAKSEAPAAPKPKPDANGVRVLSMRGPMLHRPPAWVAEFGIEHTDTLGLAAQIQAADADASVKSISIDADTPGGMVGGVPELADAIRTARKPVAVTVDGMLASAGVWAVAHADTITASRSSEIGSIGVYTVRVDKSKMLEDAGIKLHLVSSGGVKGGGADGRVTPDMLAEDARIVGQIRDDFVREISAGRGRDLAARATGHIWLAADAQRIGLIDTITGAAVPDAAETREDSMDLNPLAALAAKHPTKAGEILKLAAEGKTDSEIAMAMESAAHADALAAAEKQATDAKALADKHAADLKAEQDKSAALTAEVADLKGKLEASEKAHGKIKALGDTAAKDPGDGVVTSKAITKAEYDKNPREYAKGLADGSITITA